MKIEIPYYEDKTRISNSNIGWLLKKGPQYLKSQLEGKVEELKLPFLEKGTMIHEYILQPEEFWKDYIILDFEVPKVKQQKDLIEEYSRLLKLEPFKDQDTIKYDAYKKAYSNKKTKEKCIEEAEVLLDTYKDYINYLDKKDDKKIISFADLTLLKSIKQNMIQHKKANELLFAFPDTYEVHNEFHINWEYPNASELGDLPCKSLLDRVMIDHKNKNIILVDIKTTSDIYNFKHSVEEYDYCRQLAYYWLAIHFYFKNELNIDLSKEDYTYETYIIAVQTNNGNEVKVFNFKPNDIEDRLSIIEKAIKAIAWHKNNNLWEHTKEYYESDGSEDLCL